MECSLTNAQKLIEEYNRLYGTSFTTTDPYRLFPGEDGEYEFKNKSWPCNGMGGVYLILSKNLKVIYIGEALWFGRAFYSHFKPNGDKCEIISNNWKAKPYAIVAIPAPDDRKFERSSLKRYLVQKLKPIDNTLEK